MPYKNKVAVLGAGLTRFMRRALETPKELAFEAAKIALEDAGLTIDDIDCVVSVTAPEAFDGVHMNGEYLADAAGAWGKPYMRTYVGPSAEKSSASMPTVSRFSTSLAGRESSQTLS